MIRLFGGKKLKTVWEIRTGSGLSFLVGTAHFFPHSFRKSFQLLFRSADIAIFEGPLDEQSMQAAANSALSENEHNDLFAQLDANIIKQICSLFLPPESRRNSLGLLTPIYPETAVLTMLKGMKPWFAFFTIYREFLQKKGWRHSVDMEGFHIAKKMNLKISYLETMDEQLAVLETLDPGRIVDFLNRIDYWDQYAKDMASNYLAGNLDAIASNPNRFPTRNPDVIDRRDEIMFRRMMPYLKHGRAVVLVGIPHVVGIKKMLAQEGIDAVQCTI